MNGRQLADAVRAMRSGIKVLFITGYAENAVLKSGDLSDDMQVLTKPFKWIRLQKKFVRCSPEKEPTHVL